MSFVSPIWLIALAPWAALAVWILMGKRPRAAVPFLDLWRGPAGPARARRAWHVPPVSVICLLFAILGAILTAARPAVRAPTRALTLIVDRGPTMVTKARLAEASELDAEVRPTRLIAVASSLEAAVRDALQTPGVPVVVFTDQAVEVADPRVVRVAPESTPQNAGIVRVAARQAPRPQVMVRVRNQSEHRSAELIVRSGSSESRRAIELPQRGGERDYFIDPEMLERSVAVELNVADDVPIDNRAWLAHQRTWAKLEPRGALPDELRRMIEVYEKARPAESESARLAILVGDGRIDANQPAVVLAPGADGHVQREVELKIDDHPVAAHIDWQQLVSSDLRIAPAPGAGWRPIVLAGQYALVAVRESPARQVWVGFDAPGFARSADYVIFWASAFDWAGEAGEEFAGEPVKHLGDDWERIDPPPGADERDAPAAGLFAGPDGALRALNVLDLWFDVSRPSPWRRQLASVETSTGVGRIELSKWTALCSVTVACLGIVLASKKLMRAEARTPVGAPDPAENARSLPA